MTPGASCCWWWCRGGCGWWRKSTQNCVKELSENPLKVAVLVKYMIDMISYIGDENFCGKNVHERRVRPTLIWPLGDGVLAEGGTGNQPGARSKQPPAYLQSAPE